MILAKDALPFLLILTAASVTNYICGKREDMFLGCIIAGMSAVGLLLCLREMFL